MESIVDRIVRMIDAGARREDIAKTLVAEGIAAELTAAAIGQAEMQIKDAMVSDDQATHQAIRALGRSETRQEYGKPVQSATRSHESPLLLALIVIGMFSVALYFAFEINLSGSGLAFGPTTQAQSPFSAWCESYAFSETLSSDQRTFACDIAEDLVGKEVASKDIRLACVSFSFSEPKRALCERSVAQALAEYSRDH
ncbi:MAG: hypothetical protein ABIH41_02275 [Nanoarchaeota archaeon]